MAFSRILLGLGLLFLICAWAHYSNPYPHLGQILSDPQKFSGQRVAIFVEARIAERTVDGFILVQQGQRLRVHAEVKDAPCGEFVAVAGVFQPPDRLYADNLRIARGRRWKMVVSVIPALVLMVFLPLALRVDRHSRTLTLRKGPHA